MVNLYEVGRTVRVTAAFTDPDGVAIDPDTVQLVYETPSGGHVTWDYNGSPDEITKTSAGNYRADIPVTEAGRWYYRWLSTGAGKAADEGEFMVEAGNLD